MRLIGPIYNNLIRIFPKNNQKKARVLSGLIIMLRTYSITAKTLYI